MRIFKVKDTLNTPCMLSLFLAESVIMSIALDMAKMPIYNSILVAQCRSRCIDKFLDAPDPVTLRACQDSKNCFMCWETCELLNQDLDFWGHMCANRVICFPGCVESCTYYILEGNQVLSLNFSLMDQHVFSPPMAIYHRENEDIITWGRPRLRDSDVGVVPRGVVVYAVVEFDFDNDTWTEVDQVVSNMMVIKSQKDRRVGFMLLAVNATHVLAKQQKKYSFNLGRSLDQLTPTHLSDLLQNASGLQDEQPSDLLSRTPRNFLKSRQKVFGDLHEVDDAGQIRDTGVQPSKLPLSTDAVDIGVDNASVWHDGAFVTLFIALALNATLLGSVLLYLTYYRKNLLKPSNVLGHGDLPPKVDFGTFLEVERDFVRIPADVLDPTVKFSRSATGLSVDAEMRKNHEKERLTVSSVSDVSD